ncbi:MAG TPA: hypothetical protein VJL34_13935 [Anaerolineales bacterium]|nr:hypothetical protein [Anaerolineales bacterium]
MSKLSEVNLITFCNVGAGHNLAMREAIELGRKKLDEREDAEKAQRESERQAARDQILERQKAVRQALPAYVREHVEFASSIEAEDIKANFGEYETVQLVIPHLAPIEVDLRYDFDAQKWKVGGPNGRHYSVLALSGGEFTGPSWNSKDPYFTTELEIALAIAADRGEAFEVIAGKARLHLEPRYEEVYD